MTPAQAASDVRVAFDNRDRDAMERALVQLERMAAWCPQPPAPARTDLQRAIEVDARPTELLWHP